MKFRKKPVVIEAHRFMGPFSMDEMPEDFQIAIKPMPHLGSGPSMFYHIKTLEGRHDITVGDWIIKGVKGEFYPCKPDIFEMTYEPAEGG